MKTATEILRKEHDAILGMLDLTESAAARLDRGQVLPPGTLAGLLEFFQLFADRCHHGKEEDLLFPLLEKKGMPREGGPLGVMLFEHEQGRALIQEMKAADEALQAGEAEARRRWARAARGYAAVLREHISKENNILFVMAERLLSAEEQSELAAGFDRAEIEKMGAGTHERLHASMEQLSRTLSVEPVYSCVPTTRRPQIFPAPRLSFTSKDHWGAICGQPLSSGFTRFAGNVRLVDQRNANQDGNLWPGPAIE